MLPEKPSRLSWIYDLYRLGQEVLPAGDPDRTRRLILSHIVRAVNASSGSLALRDYDTQDISLVAGIGIPSEVIGTPVIPGQGILGWVAVHGEALIIKGDISSDPRFKALPRRPRASTPASALCWPLKNAAGDLVGLISANRKQDVPPFTEDDLEHGRTLGNLMTLLIENQWLHEKRQQRIDALSKLNVEIEESKRRLERTHHELLHTKKMALLGQFAAGVAHEINNPLGYIYSNLSTLRNYLDPLLTEHTAAVVAPGRFVPSREDINELVDDCLLGIQRVSRVVRDLTDFSRFDDTEWRWTDINMELARALNIASGEIKNKATVEKEFGQLPLVWGLAVRLTYLFVNLLVNAAQAIERDGRITVRTGVENEEVWVSVDDNGCGIPPEIQDRIFEPFFTTKRAGKGTGLGLSLSYNIVQKHCGRIEFSTTPGRGTTFTVRLPIRPPALAEPTPTL